jgi:peroxiredoxin
MPAERSIGPGVGDAAPDAEILDRTGVPARLADVWAEQPAVVVFLRYFGCPFCQAQVVSLREEHMRFARLGTRISLIGQGTPTDCAEFCDRQRIEFDVFVDPERVAFRAFGLIEGGIRQVLTPAVLLPWVKNELKAETRQGGLRGGSFMQMPGTFVVDTTGIVRFAHRNRHVADTPRNQAILDVLAKIPNSRS